MKPYLSFMLVAALVLPGGGMIPRWTHQAIDPDVWATEALAPGLLSKRLSGMLDIPFWIRLLNDFGAESEGSKMWPPQETSEALASRLRHMIKRGEAQLRRQMKNEQRTLLLQSLAQGRNVLAQFIVDMLPHYEIEDLPQVFGDDEIPICKPGDWLWIYLDQHWVPARVDSVDIHYVFALPLMQQQVVTLSDASRYRIPSRLLATTQEIAALQLPESSGQSVVITRRMSLGLIAFVNAILQQIYNRKLIELTAYTREMRLRIMDYPVNRGKFPDSVIHRNEYRRRENSSETLEEFDLDERQIDRPAHFAEALAYLIEQCAVLPGFEIDWPKMVSLDLVLTVLRVFGRLDSLRNNDTGVHVAPKSGSAGPQGVTGQALSHSESRLAGDQKNLATLSLSSEDRRRLDEAARQVVELLMQDGYGTRDKTLGLVSLRDSLEGTLTNPPSLGYVLTCVWDGISPFLLSGEAPVRAQAYHALGELADARIWLDEKGFQLLGRGVEDPDPEVRMAAAWSFQWQEKETMSGQRGPALSAASFAKLAAAFWREGTSASDRLVLMAAYETRRAAWTAIHDSVARLRPRIEPEEFSRIFVDICRSDNLAEESIAQSVKLSSELYQIDHSLLREGVALTYARLYLRALRNPADGRGSDIGEEAATFQTSLESLLEDPDSHIRKIATWMLKEWKLQARASAIQELRQVRESINHQPDETIQGAVSQAITLYTDDSLSGEERADLWGWIQEFRLVLHERRAECPPVSPDFYLPILDRPEDFLSLAWTLYDRELHRSRFDAEGIAIPGESGFNFNPADTRLMRRKSVGIFEAILNLGRESYVKSVKQGTARKVTDIRDFSPRAKLFVLRLGSGIALVTLNQNPMMPGNLLLVPYMNDRLPQKLTPEVFREVLELCDLPSNSDLRVVFNQDGELGTVPMLHFQLFIHETKPWAIDHAPLEDVTLTQDTKVRRIMGRLERYPVEAVVLEAGSALARAEEALSFIAVTDAAGFIYQPLISLGRIIIAPRLKPLPEAWGMHILAYHAAGKVVSFVLGAFESMTIRDIFDHNRRASILPARLDDLLRAYIRRDDGELRRAA